MYEIFSDRGILEQQRRNIQRRNIAMKGGCILKSKGNNVLKKKRVFADLSNIKKQDNEDDALTKDEHKSSKPAECYENRNGCVERSDYVKDGHQRLFEKIMEERNAFSGASHEVPDYVLDNPYLCSKSVVLDETSNSTLEQNPRIEEDVFFGTYYSISEDEKELINSHNWDMDAPETIYEYCSEGGSCDESYDSRWLETPIWKTSEEFHQIVGVPDTSKSETFVKLEDMDFTSLFSEMPYAVKATLDVPDVLFGSDYEDDSPVIPVPDLEW